MCCNRIRFTIVAFKLACGEARGGRIPRQWVCNRRATKPQANLSATQRAAVLFRADFVVRSLQIHCGICSSLSPRLREKFRAAIVKPILLQHTNVPPLPLPLAESSGNLEESMWQLCKEFLSFLKQEKKWWLIPLIVVLLTLAGLILFSGSSVLAPFMYPFM